MSEINPLDYELNYGKKIFQSTFNNYKNNRTAIIVTYHNTESDYSRRIFPIAISMLRKNGTKVANHAINSIDLDRIARYLKIQASEVLYFPEFIDDCFYDDIFNKIAKIIYNSNYSFISYISLLDMIEIDIEYVKNDLEEIGFNVVFIKENYLPPESLFSDLKPSKEALKYNDIDQIPNCNLKCDLNKNNQLHKTICDNKLNKIRNDGIYEAKTKNEIDIAESLSILAQMECCWESPLVTRDVIKKGVKVYLYIVDNRVKGFVAFDEFAYINNKKETIKTSSIAEVYTCPKYRLKGIAGKLIDHGIDVLKIDKNNLCVHAPVMPAAQNIILKKAGENVIIKKDNVCKIGSKEVVRQIWGI